MLIGLGAVGVLGILKAVAAIGGGCLALWGAYEYFASEMEDAKTEGVKEGYEKASREYEAKLRAQAQEFKTQLTKLAEEIEKLRRERDEARTFAWRLFGRLFGSNPAEKFAREEQELHTQEQELARQGFTLLGNFEGCISKAEEQGFTVDNETWDCYKQLQDITNGIQANAKISTAA